MVNSLWKNSPGFLIWNVWKERNNRIFQKRGIRQLEDLKIIIMQGLTETTRTWCTEEKVDTISPNDRRILGIFGLIDSVEHLLTKTTLRPIPPPVIWQRPPHGFCKLNFDGAAKGNPGPVGAGGVLRDENGSIIHILSKNLGETTNNYAEFTALEQGLRLLV